MDAVKLLIKGKIDLARTNVIRYQIAPILSLSLRMLLWFTIPFSKRFLKLNYSILIILLISSLIIFLVLLAGWARNSKYRYIGRIRGIAQSISYEAVIRTLFILLILITYSYSIERFKPQSKLIFLALFAPLYIRILAETYRAPFDFREAERELVRGFNTEYRGALFAFLFLREYTRLLFYCLFLSVVIFFGGMWRYSILLRLTILVRIVAPRYRYDYLILFAWKRLLPVRLYILLFFLLV